MWKDAKQWELGEFEDLKEGECGWVMVSGRGWGWQQLVWQEWRKLNPEGTHMHADNSVLWESFGDEMEFLLYPGVWIGSRRKY